MMAIATWDLPQPAAPVIELNLTDMLVLKAAAWDGSRWGLDATSGKILGGTGLCVSFPKPVVIVSKKCNGARFLLRVSNIHSSGSILGMYVMSYSPLVMLSSSNWSLRTSSSTVPCPTHCRHL